MDPKKFGSWFATGLGILVFILFVVIVYRLITLILSL